jgi:hypothetical protein
MKLTYLTMFAAAMMAVSSASASTITLLPGGTVPFFTPTVSAFSGTLVATYSMTFSNAAENGTVFEDVYQSGGVLDFYYKVTNNSSSKDTLSRVTVSTFVGFTTSVDYLLNGGDAPTTATEQVAGNSVGFYDLIKPGTSSDWLEIATNAKAYNADGTIAVIDSVAINFNNALAPSTSVPEPISLSLIGGGLLLMGAAGWRRSKNRA